MVSTKELIRYVVGELSDRRFNVTKTGLVKLLYLVDVESLRLGLPRVSEVKWVFYNYGPYAHEIDEALRSLSGTEVDETSGISSLGRSFYGYRARPVEELSRIPLEARGVIKDVLDKWGGEDLNKLLNYVYFETEPMLNADWGKPLDLDLVQPRQEQGALADYLARKVSREEAEQLARLKREFWARAADRRKRLTKPALAPRYDDVFREGLRVTEENEDKP